jgi:hypothetical protein
LLKRVVRSFLLRVEARRACSIVFRHQRTERVLMAFAMVGKVEVSDRLQG